MIISANRRCRRSEACLGNIDAWTSALCEARELAQLDATLLVQRDALDEALLFNVSQVEPFVAWILAVMNPASRSRRRDSARVTRGGMASISTPASWYHRGIGRGSSACAAYALRPPIAQERLHLTAQGQVVLDRRHRWADGTTHLVFDPVELLERLAALTPRPRINLLLYYGVLGARSAWRSRLRDADPERPAETARGMTSAETAAAATTVRPRANWLWAELMQRSFGVDVLACPRYGDRLELIEGFRTAEFEKSA